MNLLMVVAIAAVVLSIAYVTYGRFLSRFLQLDARRPTPAVELRDDLDYVPIESKFLLSQHFSAIAAAGPIVGPILAGVMFGWLPALIWILVGSIFIGGVHDMTALTASIRHKARSIAEVVRDHMSRRSYMLFLIFIWIALVYIIVAFTDVTASAFVGGSEALRRGDSAAVDLSTVSAETVAENGPVTGGAIAASSLLYLVLPIIMGLLLRYTRMSLNVATLIFVPLVGVVIWVGQYMPIDVGLMVQHFRPALSLPEADHIAQKIWDVVLLGYCMIAGVIPVWLLLQPRGHLGGVFLYVALVVGAIGAIFGNFGIQYDAFKGFDAVGANGETFFPFLFITIACGACSGFHSVIASGTTSKQLRLETDAKPIGYGAMLLEAMVATFALCVRDDARPGQRSAQAVAKPDLRRRPGFVPGCAARAARLRCGIRIDGLHDVRLRHARCVYAAGAVHRAGTHRSAQLGRPLARRRANGPHSRAAGNANHRGRGRQPDTGVADFLVSVRRHESVARRTHAVGRYCLVVADAANVSGVASHRSTHRIHVCDEHLGTGEDDLAQVLRCCGPFRGAARPGAVGRRVADRSGRHDALRGAVGNCKKTVAAAIAAARDGVMSAFASSSDLAQSVSPRLNNHQRPQELAFLIVSEHAFQFVVYCINCCRRGPKINHSTSHRVGEYQTAEISVTRD